MPQAVAAVASFIGSVFSGTVFGAGATGLAAVGNAAAQAAAFAAVQASVSAAVRNNTKRRDQGSLINLELNASAPRRLVVGKRITGGVLTNWFLAGNNNVKLFMPIYLSQGPCGRLMRVFGGGREVYSTPISHGVKTEITAYRSGGPRLWLTYFDGRPGQGVPSDLTALGISSNNKMTGCAWVLVEAWWDSDNQRTPPALTFELEGAKLYDRRKDSTAGGSGSHRADNPSTWEWSDNAMVGLDHFMLGRYVNGVRVMGIGRPATSLPYDRFAAQANVCDENVTLSGGGTQKRYRANGIVFADEQFDDVIKKFCAVMAARPADYGGRFGVVGVEARTPVMTIDDGDLILGAPSIYKPKQSWSNLFSAVEGKYQDPAQLYQAQPYPRVSLPAWVAEDGGGEAKVLVRDYEYEVDHERAQRLALLDGQAARRQAQLTETYPIWAVELERGDWFIRTGKKWGEDGKTFEVMERIFDPRTFTVNVISQEVDPADSAWSVDYAQDPPPDPIPGTASFADLDPPSLSVEAVTLALEGMQTVGLKVQWDWPDPDADENDTGPDDAPPDTRIKWIYIEAEATEEIGEGDDAVKPPKVSATVAIPSEEPFTILAGGLVGGVEYAVSAKWLTNTFQSDWSAAIIVTASSTSGGIESVDTLPTTGNYDGRIVRLRSDNKLYVWNDPPGEWVPLTSGGSTGGPVGIESGSTLPTTGNFEGRMFWLTTDRRLYIYHVGVGWVPMVGAFPTGIVGIEQFSTAPTTGNFEGRIYYNSTDGRLYRYHSGAWTATTPAADITGSLTDSQIAALDAAKLTGSITGTQIANGTITTAKIASAQITASLIAAATIVASNIASQTITASQIAAHTITAGQITAGTITASEIASHTITANQIAATTITAGEIAAATITGDRLVAGTITASQIAANTITASQIASGTITATQIASGTITATQIASGTITATQIAANTITASRLNVSSLSAITATIGTLRTAVSGARVEISDNLITVYDSSGTLRVRLGIW